MTITQTQTSEPAMGVGGLPAGEEDAVLLEFSAGLPGFPASRRFRLESLGPELEPFCAMRSVAEPEICFTVVPPGIIFRDYAVEIDEQHVDTLGLADGSDALVLAIVTVGDPPTANLLGPLVVNRRTRVAAQVVQHGSDYGAAVPLVSADG